MPELPEVESLRRELNSTCTGQAIQNVELKRKDLRFPFQKNLTQTLNGKQIKEVKRRAKYIVFSLTDTANQNSYMVSHLGMTGTWTWVKENSNYDLRKHDHVVITLSHGRLVYNDPRRFGHLFWCNDIENTQKPLDLSSLGVEPFSYNFTAEYLMSCTSRKPSTVIKTFIMDQTVVVGVGNIYASEALFWAKINPLRKTKTLKVNEAKMLVDNIKRVLTEGIDAGGTTLRDYRSLGEGKGSYQDRLKVYDRENLPCVVCKSKIKSAKVTGRSTYWCAKCQK